MLSFTLRLQWYPYLEQRGIQGHTAAWFGVGYALYCAGQGTARMEWPVAGAIVRTAVAIAGGALAAQYGSGPPWIFIAASAGMVAFACFSLPGLLKRVGYDFAKAP